MDSYQTDFNDAEKQVNIITTSLDELKSIKQKNPNASVVSQEYKMKQASLKLKSQINDLDVLAMEYQNSGSKF